MRKKSATDIDMGRYNTACFTGYRPQKLPWGYNEADPRCIAFKQRLAEAITTAYSLGFNHFITGGAIGVDMYAAERVMHMREAGDDIVLEIILPYPSFNGAFEGMLGDRFTNIVLSSELLWVPSDEYASTVYVERNSYMVDESGLVIAGFDGQEGGTKNTIDQAYRKGASIWIIDPNEHY